jgi:N6-adenosine-specific RNA methylase IME4
MNPGTQFPGAAARRPLNLETESSSPSVEGRDVEGGRRTALGNEPSATAGASVPGTGAEGANAPVNGRYRTIVADPPWPYPEGWPVGRTPAGAKHDGRRTPLAYEPLSVEEIAHLGVSDMAERDAHLYLWTTNRYLRDAYVVAQAWGFRVSQLLIWTKTPMGIGPGGTWAQNVEYVVFARRGKLKSLRRFDSCWFNWPRTGRHSAKPEAMLDMVEQASPGPYLEMFARRARFGWDYWGDQSLGTASMPTTEETAA